jgi:vacuolar-type H+-ATPase subunit I/STV1
MLNDEQRAEFEAAIESNFEEAPSETPEVTQDVKEEQPSEEEEHVEAAPEEASQEEIDDSPPPESKGHKVPYNRFKNVLEARNKFQSQASEYKTQVSSLEEKLQALQSQTQHTPAQTTQVESKNSWLDEYLKEGTQEAAAPEWQQQYRSLNDRLYQFEVAQEEVKLRVELDNLVEVFPSVPQEFLIQAVINDPNVDLANKAEEYHAFVSGVGEKAIARYLEESPQGTADVVPEVPKRPSSTGSRPAQEYITPSKKPTSIGDASSALRNALSKHNFLKDE